jgi:hypothetical protein
MIKRRTTFVIITIFVLTSCVTNKHIFIGEMFSDFDKLKINTIQIFEIKNKSKDITPTHFIKIGESIYPNRNQYKLETPRVFQRQEKPNFQVEIDYYYVLVDSSVKVILYQWDDLPSKKNETFENDRDTAQKFSRFQTKFNQLKDTLTKVLGTPILNNMEQTKVPSGETFRDGIKWQRANGMNAYLFMFGNNKSRYRQIRLAIYRD